MKLSLMVALTVLRSASLFAQLKPKSTEWATVDELVLRPVRPALGAMEAPGDRSSAERLARLKDWPKLSLLA